LQPPLCAVRAGQKKNQVFYIGEEKRSKKKEKNQPNIAQFPNCQFQKRFDENRFVIFIESCGC